MQDTQTAERPLTQVDLEKEMYAFGRARVSKMIEKNEESGRAAINPYAKAVYRRFILPLADAIKSDLQVRKAGRARAHVALLAPMDPEAVAYLSVRSVINNLFQSRDLRSGRTIVSEVGRACYHELLLGLFEQAEPALFHTLVNDLGRRMSQNERHKLQLFRMQANSRGIPVPDWGRAGTTQVGSYLINKMEELGLLRVYMRRHRRGNATRTDVEVTLAPDVIDLITEIKAFTVDTMPYYLPCIEPPIDWTAIDDGGWHTTEMRRQQPFAVKSDGDWSRHTIENTGNTLAAINCLQNVRWRVNSDMLDAVKRIARHFDMDEIISQAESPAPPRPIWLTEHMTKETMSDGQLKEFVAWKREKAEWFTQNKLRTHKYGRFHTALRVAEKFVDYPTIYFVYFADFRGRLYAQTTGISPQGSDLQRALLTFADGKPLDSVEAEKWFCIHGANKWGYDKATLDDRVAWVKEHHRMLMDFAADPVANSAWTEADKPLQFLAWCFEYAEWQKSPDTFVSRIPVGMDGSCNGLQNFSAMLRDEVGGRATNLIPSTKPHDIYQMVADVVALNLRQSAPDDKGFRDRWLAHGMNRSLVKRSVMTLPYGSTRYSCADFIVEDYLKQGKATEFSRDEYHAAATFLSHYVWAAIGEVVVKASEAMAWLQRLSDAVIKGGGQSIAWSAPTGFPVVQYYQERQEHRIRTNLCGNAFLRTYDDADQPNARGHRNGISPNFIHSMDASHMTFTILRAAMEGLSLAMVHDDYGTHAADAARLSCITRETFVAMYEQHNPLRDLADRYGFEDPPKRGLLDLHEVLDSQYFFA